MLLPIFYTIHLSAQTYSITNLKNTIKVDGTLEQCWYNCDSIKHFTQLEPTKGAITTEKTIVRVMQDNANIYFSFVCNYSSPLVANINNRDQLNSGDDMVGLILDTYYVKQKKASEQLWMPK